MEKNTAILDLQEYYELKSLKENLDSGNIYVITDYGYRFYVKNKDISEFIDNIIKDRNRAVEIDHKMFSEMRNTIENVKEMNIFQFIKWKRKNKSNE